MAPDMKLTRMHNGAVERMVDFRKIIAIVKKNWMVLKSDKVRLFPLILFPIVMIIVFGYASGNVPKHLPAAVVDYDQSVFSYAVQKELSAVDVFSVKAVVGTEDEGRRMMDRGEIKVLFILPGGIGEKVARGEPADILLMVDESDSAVASVAKATAQSLAARLSVQVTNDRLAAVSASAQAARQELAAAEAAAQSAAGGEPAFPQDAATSYWNDANYVYSRTGKSVDDTVAGLKNSLGYLVDQNEVADSFTPASMTSATVALLATGDSQQSVLQQIGSYSGIRAAQAMMMRDAGAIYSGYLAVYAQMAGRQESSAVSVKLLQAAGKRLEGISQAAESAHAPVELGILEPYGYGRRGIDFLLPAILALTIFQGATMGLGRAIAGERKDGSMTRVFLTPTSNVSIIMGTQVFYMILETVRSSLIILVAVALFGVSITGSVADIVFIIAIYAIGATGVGMVLSVIASNQEQYMALAMLISLPIMFLSGVFFPVQTMPPILQGVAQFLPVTYAADALRGVMVKGFALHQLVPDLIALLAFGALTLTLSILLFKRELV